MKYLITSGSLALIVGSALLATRAERAAVSEKRSLWGTAGRFALPAAELVIAAWAIFSIVLGLSAALWFSGDAADGPFLVFNGLRRIAAGQVGGRDFVDIHGIGLPYLHYPLFALLGGKSIGASEISRQLTSTLLFFASLWSFIRAAMGKGARTWIAMAFSILALEAAFPRDAVGTPGNLDAWVRSAVPIFAFAVLLAPLSSRLKPILTGCCIALAFLIGTEHGISLVVAIVTVAALSFIQALTVKAARPAWLENLRFALGSIGVALVVASAFLLFVCGPSGAQKALYFNLVEMPIDQIWFFGGPPMPYIGVWKDLLDRHAILTLLPTYIALVLLASILLSLWKQPLRIGRNWHALALIMLVYGILSGVPLLAILSRHYAFTLTRVLILVAVLMFANLIIPRLPEFSLDSRFRRWSGIAAASFVVACVVGSIALLTGATSRAIAFGRHLESGSTQSSYSRFLDAHWNSFMTNVTRLIDSRRKRTAPSIWSVYSGLLEAHYGIFQPTQDYIIHASYGPLRWQRYLDTLRASDPEFVTTMTPAFGFEEWLENERWNFFQSLVDNYHPVAEVEHMTVWQRKPGQWTTPQDAFRPIALDKPDEFRVFPAPGGSDQLSIVRVRYTITNHWNWLPLFGKTPRYLASIEGSRWNLPVSFPPYLSQFDFPVRVPPDHPVRIHFYLTSLLPGTIFRVDSVQARTLDLDPAQRAFFLPAERPTPQ